MASSNTLTSLFQELNQRFLADTSPQILSQNVKSLEFTLNEIWNLYDQNVPEFSEKYLIFYNAKGSFLNDLLYFVHNNLETENNSLNKILDEIKDKNHAAVQEVKE